MKTIELLVAATLISGGCVAASPTPSTQDVAASDRTPPTFTLGGPCAQNADCDSSPGAGDGFCYVNVIGLSAFSPEGYCTIDDGSGAICATDADCGPGNQCADSAGYRFCLPSCAPDGSCGADQACLTSFIGYPLDRPACVPGSATAQDGDACNGVYQCGADSICDNSIEDPGGRCAKDGCTVGDDTTCNGGTCVAVNDYPEVGNLCLAACQTDNDCRAEEGYRCVDPGNGDAHYCWHPRIGDACQTSTDCGDGLTCYVENGASAGTCTQSCTTPNSEDSCSYGSLCEPVHDQFWCVNRCDTDADCSGGNVCTDVGVANGGACMPPSPGAVAYQHAR